MSQIIAREVKAEERRDEARHARGHDWLATPTPRDEERTRLRRCEFRTDIRSCSGMDRDSAAGLPLRRSKTMHRAGGRIEVSDVHAGARRGQAVEQPAVLQWRERMKDVELGHEGARPLTDNHGRRCPG